MTAKTIGIIVGVVAVAAMAVALSKRKSGTVATNPDLPLGTDYMGLDYDDDGVVDSWEYIGPSNPTSAARA